MSDTKSWRLDFIEDIAVLTLDVPQQSANVLSHAVLTELDQRLAELENKPLKGLIICSGKPSGFIAGADVREFQKISDPVRAAELARTGQKVFGRLANLPFPTAAVIHGFCLGGGMELALACTYRIARDDAHDSTDGGGRAASGTAAEGSASPAPRGSASGARDDASTRLGLPEVKLGIHPGFAGTVRLPPLVGHLPALGLMLTGRTVSAKEARRLGLVDEVAPERHLRHAATSILRRRPPRRKAPWYHRLVGFKPLRPLVARLLTRQLHGKANPDHYPAPYRMVELWRNDANEEQEAVSIGELLVSRTSRNLVHVFLLGEELKRQGRTQPHHIKHVHVVGAGVMGADIAMWAANKGFSVSLQDRSPEILARAMRRAYEFFRKKLKDPRAIQEAMDRLMPDMAGNGLKRADLVIEAIVEKVESKRELFRHVEQRAPANALLATNTSSIPLEEIATALKDPVRLVGLHFFNPVAKMQLVEIVRGQQTNEDALARARAFTVAIERLPLDVRSSPGFLVNRILMPYLIEAVKLYEEGVPAPQIDRAARDFGMPMGPIELADTVGLDICLSVAEELAGPLDTPVPETLRKMVADKKLGKKSGSGFYEYNAKGRAKAVKSGPKSDLPITERLVLRLLNEAVACLREKVVSNTDAVDAGMVYGTGFAPYLGGPMRYVESLGETGISHSLYRLSQEYGKRFTPDPGWSRTDLFQRRYESKD